MAKMIHTLKVCAGSDAGRSISELLATDSGLSKSKIKDAMVKGAVWLTRPGRSAKRLRRATTVARTGDKVVLYYDAQVLSFPAPAATCLNDEGRYSVWLKPAGLLTQGTLYGDHCTLERQVQARLSGNLRPHAVHRLDREAAGLVLLAHTRYAAKRLSVLFRDRLVHKYYHVVVRGEIEPPGESGCIDMPLNGKRARTCFVVAEYDPVTDASLLEVSIETGRKHQIRRHFARIGHPVMGDPRYGRNNKNNTGLALMATRLAFRCPFSQRSRQYEVARHFWYEDLWSRFTSR